MCMGAAGRNAVTPAGHARVSYVEAAAGVASKGEHASASAVVRGVPGWMDPPATVSVIMSLPDWCCPFPS